MTLWMKLFITRVRYTDVALLEWKQDRALDFIFLFSSFVFVYFRLAIFLSNSIFFWWIHQWLLHVTRLSFFVPHKCTRPQVTSVDQSALKARKVDDQAENLFCPVVWAFTNRSTWLKHLTDYWLSRPCRVKVYLLQSSLQIKYISRGATMVVWK